MYIAAYDTACGAGYELRCYHCNFYSGPRAIDDGKSLSKHIADYVAVINAFYTKLANVAGISYR